MLSQRIGKALLILGVVLCASTARAGVILVPCERLSPVERDELRARAALLFLAAAAEGIDVSVECTDRRAWLVWREFLTERVAVDEAPGLIEGTLQAIDARLQARAAGYERAVIPPKPKPPTSLAAGDRESPALTQPSFDAPLDTGRSSEETPREKPRGIGGAGLAMSGESWRQALGVGPRLDIGVSTGPVAISITESLKFGKLEGRQLQLLDTQLGIAWGAPFHPEYRFGVTALFGAEWLYSWGGQGEAGQANMAGIVSLGGRAALPVKSLALWLGLDLRYRLNRSGLGSPTSIELPRLGAIVSLGGFLLVDETLGAT